MIWSWFVIATLAYLLCLVSACVRPPDRVAAETILGVLFGFFGPLPVLSLIPTYSPLIAVVIVLVAMALLAVTPLVIAALREDGW